MKKVSRVVIRYAPFVTALFLCASYEIGVHMDKAKYYDIAVYLYETVNAGLWFGFVLLCICSWHKLCTYNWLSSFLVIATSLFNIIAKAVFDESDFYFYAELYSIIIIPLALLMIGIAFSKRKKTKQC